MNADAAVQRRIAEASALALYAGPSAASVCQAAATSLLPISRSDELFEIRVLETVGFRNEREVYGGGVLTVPWHSMHDLLLQPVVVRWHNAQLGNSSRISSVASNNRVR
jgi:hypothetical protein